MTEQKFQLNDRVSAFGVEGVVKKVDLVNPPVGVDFDTYPNRIYFDSDGKYERWHKEPSLTLIERPKKMKKVWVNLYNDENKSKFWSYFSSKEFADKYPNDRVTCVEIEIEE